MPCDQFRCFSVDCNSIRPCGYDRKADWNPQRRIKTRQGGLMGRIAKKDYDKLRLIASQAVKRAILNGELLPILEYTLCVDCSKPAACYDHRDYNKPLEVEPVCTSCNGLRGPAKPYPEECDTKETATFLRRIAAYLYPDKYRLVKYEAPEIDVPNWQALMESVLKTKKGYETAQILDISGASVSRIKDGTQTNLTWETGEKLIKLASHNPPK